MMGNNFAAAAFLEADKGPILFGLGMAAFSGFLMGLLATWIF